MLSIVTTSSLVDHYPRANHSFDYGHYNVIVQLSQFILSLLHLLQHAVFRCFE